MPCGQIGCAALPFFFCFFSSPLQRNERFPERNHCFPERFHRAVRGEAGSGERHRQRVMAQTRTPHSGRSHRSLRTTPCAEFDPPRLIPRATTLAYSFPSIPLELKRAAICPAQNTHPAMEFSESSIQNNVSAFLGSNSAFPCKKLVPHFHCEGAVSRGWKLIGTQGIQI